MLKLVNKISKFQKIYSIFFVAVVLLLGCSSNQLKLNYDYQLLIGKSLSGKGTIDTSFLKENAVNYVISGANLTQQGRFAEGILDYLEALKYDSSASIYYAIAKNYKDLYRYNSAIEFINYSLKLDSVFLPSIRLLADVYSLQYKLTETVTVYQQLVKLEPTKSNKQTLAMLYETYDPKKAAELYESIVKDGEDAQILGRLAYIYSNILRDDQSYFNALLRLDKTMPGSLKSKVAFIDYYLVNKKYDSAFVHLDYINKNFSSSEIGPVFSSITDNFYSDTSEAVKPFISRFLNYFDSRFYFDWRTLNSAAYLYGKLNDTINRDKVLDRILKVDDTLADAVIAVASVYTTFKENDKALTLLNARKAEFPKDTRFALFLASINSLKKNYRISADILLDAIRKFGDDFELLMQLGMTYDRIGNFDSTLIIYDRALKLRPDDPLINNNYAYSLSEKGIRLEEALNMSQKALRTEPENGSYLDTYGWIQYKLGNYSIALEWIYKALDTKANGEEVFEHLIEIYLKMGNKTKAKEILANALKIFPDNINFVNKYNEIK